MCVPIKSHRCFRVNLHFTVAWMSRKFLLETGAKFSKILLTRILQKSFIRHKEIRRGWPNNCHCFLSICLFKSGIFLTLRTFITVNVIHYLKITFRENEVLRSGPIVTKLDLKFFLVLYLESFCHRQKHWTKCPCNLI